MKFKSYFMILIVLFILLGYNMFCYWLANNLINDRTEYYIKEYFNNKCDNCNFEYEYIKATLNDDQTINVFIKTDNENFNKYNRVVFLHDGSYKLLSVDQNIPVYIK